MEGKFITIEGLDGAGLSTQASMLRDYLHKNGKPTILTKEPTDRTIGGLIKSSLKNEWKTSSVALQLLFSADRAHHLSVEIEPALKDGMIVISDRYIFSTLAFGALDIDIEFLKTINSKFRKPDLIFILDVRPEVCLKRLLKDRYHLELFEVEEKLEEVRKNYLSLKDYFPNVYVIDGNRNKEDVFEDIRKIVDKII